MTQCSATGLWRAVGAWQGCNRVDKVHSNISKANSGSARVKSFTTYCISVSLKRERRAYEGHCGKYFKGYNWTNCLTVLKGKGASVRHVRCRASSSDDDNGFDIDELASRLSAEAERRRSMESQSDDDGMGSGDGPWDMLECIGDGGFYASDFELLQELGQISIQQSEEMRSDGIFRQSEKTTKTAVVAFTASYFSGMPFEDPVVTMLKEYLPGSRNVACNELRAMLHLCGIPEIDQKWRTASRLPSREPPVVETLGYFVAGPSGRATYISEGEENRNTVWVVSKWEANAPLSLYPGAQQTSGLGLGRLFGAEKQALESRKKMVRSIASGMLGAVAFCHDRFVAHGSLGSGTFLLSTFNDQDNARLIVKLDSFGFAKLGSRAATCSQIKKNHQKRLLRPDVDFEEALQSDKRRLGIIFLECALSAFQQGGPTEISSADAIERVLGEVYNWDIDSYKQYCAGEDCWVTALSFLDESHGWDLAEILVSGNSSVTNIRANHPFFTR